MTRPASVQIADDQRYIDALEAELSEETVTYVRARMRDQRRGFAIYDGSFELAWLQPGERVMSAGDGTGACVVAGPSGERRVEKGDRIELPRLDCGRVPEGPKGAAC